MAIALGEIKPPSEYELQILPGEDAVNAQTANLAKDAEDLVREFDNRISDLEEQLNGMRRGRDAAAARMEALHTALNQTEIRAPKFA